MYSLAIVAITCRNYINIYTGINISLSLTNEPSMILARAVLIFFVLPFSLVRDVF